MSFLNFLIDFLFIDITVYYIRVKTPKSYFILINPRSTKVFLFFLTMNYQGGSKMAHKTLSLYNFKTAEEKLLKFWNYIYYNSKSIYLKYLILLSRSSGDI
jgi:hypothetical protein